MRLARLEAILQGLANILDRGGPAHRQGPGGTSADAKLALEVRQHVLALPASRDTGRVKSSDTEQ